MKRLWLVLFFLGFSGCLQTRSELNDADEKRASQIQVLRQQKADADAEVGTLQAQLRDLNGRLEVLEHQQDQGSKGRDENGQKIIALEARIKALEEGILQLSQALEAVKATPAPAVKKDGKDKGSFEEGEEFFAQKDWKKAIASYQKYREAFPKGENIPTATYKIGASLQELKMNKEARVFFEEVIERFPKTKAARSASYRLKKK